ncbi:MAG: LCP family protein [Nocardioides sp.]|nr:LCP family protein [Nocardioides sp.]
MDSGGTTEQRPSRLTRMRTSVGGFRQRHPRMLLAIVIVLLLLIATCGFYGWKLNSQLGNIDRFDTDSVKNRPDGNHTGALNILLLGSDAGKQVNGEAADTDLAQDAEADEWPVGKYRSDTVMILHISEDRNSVHLVSIPRDSFVTLRNSSGEAEGKNKINAAFSEWGPNGTLSTIEHLTDIRIDHIAIIDWAGFKDLSTAVGGVPVTVPEDVYDSKQDKQWDAGDYNLKGAEALQYVRMRYGLTRGDFDRIERQQNFLRALMTKVLEAGTVYKPVKFNNTLEAITKNLTVDKDWENGDLRSLAVSLRGTKEDKVTFLTLPIGTEQTHPKYGSILKMNKSKSKELFTAMKNDRMGKYVDKYPGDVLGDEDSVG